VVQRLRLRYAKRGRLRFGSTRDFQRALERALRRAQVPVAFSAGFHPHPRISYANAAPTGAASEAEYVEIALSQRCDPLAVQQALDTALPHGLDIVQVVEVRPGDPALADRLEASEWTLAFRGIPDEALAGAVASFVDSDRIEVTRVLKAGPRTFDARGPVLAIEVENADTMDRGPGRPAGCAILRMVVRHTTPAVRPDDVLTALRAVAGLEPPSPPVVTRLAQGPLRDGAVGVADPLAAPQHSVGSAAGD